MEKLITMVYKNGTLSLSFSMTLVTNNYYDRYANGISVIVNGIWMGMSWKKHVQFDIRIYIIV